MRWLLITPLAVCLILLGAIMAFNAGFFHSRIERLASEKLGARVDLGSTSIPLTWPPRLGVGTSRVEAQGAYSVRWQKLELTALRLLPPYGVRLQLEQPIVEVKAQPAATTPENVATGGNGNASEPPPLHLAVDVHQGEFTGQGVHVRQFDLQFEQKQLLRSAAHVHLKALVEAPQIPLPLPVALDTDTLTLSRETVKATDMKVALAGLRADAQGTSLLQEGRHRWKATVEASDLAKLPQPPFEIPAKNWHGSMRLQAELVKEGTDKPWSGEGELRVHEARADLGWQKQGVAVTGPVSLNLDARFQYYGGKPVVPSCQGSLDLSAARVLYPNMIDKKAGVPLTLNVQAKGDSARLQIQNVELAFWKLKLKVNGQSELQAPFKAQLHFEVPAVTLAGAEQVLLPLSHSPVRGEVEVRGDFKGALLDAKMGHASVSAARFKNISAHVNYNQAGMVQVHGPVTLTAQAQGDWNAGHLHSVQANGELNATQAGLVVGPLRKESNQNFALRFAARNEGDEIDLGQLDLNSFFGVVQLKGKIKNPMAPELKGLTVKLAPLNLAELRVALPEYREMIPHGSVQADLRLNGTRAENKPWFSWPLEVTGAVRARLPEYKMANAESPAPSPAKAALPAKASAEPTSFLPRGPLTERLRLKINADVGQVVQDKLILKNLNVDGQVAQGHFKGGLAIQQIFSGKLQLSGLDVPLLDPKPRMEGTAVWEQLVIQDALAFAKPEFKDFATGRAAGQVSFATVMPSRAEFLSDLRAQGSLVLQPVTLNTVKVGEMINTLLDKIPALVKGQLKIQRAKVEPLNGWVKTGFALKTQVMQIENFVAHETDSSELQLAGKVTVPDLHGDLAGRFLWAKPAVQGCLLEGNSDAQGRMLIPVAVKGDLMHPGFSVLSDLLGQLGAKALRCQQKKLVQDIQKDGGKKLQEAVKKQLQGIFGK